MVSHDKVEVVGKGEKGGAEAGQRTLWGREDKNLMKKNEENSEPLRDFIFRARRLFFFSTQLEIITVEEEDRLTHF